MTFRRVVNFLIVLVAILVVSGNFVFKRYQDAHYIGILPAELEVEGTVKIETVTAFLGGCGYVVYKLSNAMIDRMEWLGLAAFREAKLSRKGGDRHYSRFDAWQETPGEIGYFLRGLKCHNTSDAWTDLVRSAVVAPGSYMTTKPEAALIVIPSERVAVLAYSD